MRAVLPWFESPKACLLAHE